MEVAAFMCVFPPNAIVFYQNRCELYPPRRSAHRRLPSKSLPRTIAVRLPRTILLDEANASLDLLNDLVGSLADKLHARVLMA